MLLVSFTLLLCSRVLDVASDTQVLVDPSHAAERFDGIGGLSAGASSRLLYEYPEPTRSQLLDLLFLPNLGAAFHILKIEIGGDVQSTWGTEPSHMHSRDDENYDRGYEWWLVKEAKKRNPNIIISALAWGEPHWVGNGSFLSAEGVDYHVKFIQGAKKYHNITVDYVGIWNEDEWDPSYIKLLRSKLDENDLQHVKIVATDGNWDIATAMANDSHLNDSVDVVGIHSPCSKTPSVAFTLHKTLWKSEEQPVNSAPPAWTSALGWIEKINKNYAVCRFTATIICPLITSWMQNFLRVNHGLISARHPYSGFYEIRRGLMVTAHVTHFVQPGWLYLPPTSSIHGKQVGSGLLKGGGSYVTLVPNATTDEFVIIMETGRSTQIQNVEFYFPRISRLMFVDVWESNGTMEFVSMPITEIAGGTFVYTLFPDSIYTFTNTKPVPAQSPSPYNRSSIPLPAPLPFLPYRDDFESDRTVNEPAKLLSDYFGTFQIFASSSQQTETVRSVNQVVRQWSPAAPGDNAWKTRNGEPITYFYGNYMNYRVQCDVLIESTNTSTPAGRPVCGAVRVCGRADLFDHEQPVGQYAGGVCLTVDCKGKWTVSSKSTKIGGDGNVLRTGNVSKFGSDEWHTLAVDLYDYKATASIDNVTVASDVSIDYYTNGLAGIGSGWNFAQFDNLVISTVREQNNSSFLLSLLPDAGSYEERSGWLGMVLNMSKTITVTALGRYYCPANKEVHQMQIFDGATNGAMLKDPVLVTMSEGFADVLGFKYGKMQLGQSLSLLSGRVYYVVSNETRGGDVWFQTIHSGHESTGDAYKLKTLMDSRVDVARVIGRVENSDKTDRRWNVTLEHNTAYGPLNLLYDIV